MARRLDRRTLLKLSGLTAVAGIVPARARAGHHPPPYPNRPPGHYPPLSEGGGGPDEGDVPTPKELPAQLASVRPDDIVRVIWSRRVS